MRVLKRGNRGYEEVDLNKISSRIKHLCDGLSPKVDSTTIAIQTIQKLYDGISTEELDKISAKTAESYKLEHPDYSILAAKICVSNLHKTTPKLFSECIKELYESLNIISKIAYDFIIANAKELDNMIIDNNDYNYDFFGFRTMEHSYLIKIGERVCDRPQYLYMRVAIMINLREDVPLQTKLENIKICYKALSQMYFTHATPTLFNSCTKNAQLGSCFLLGTNDSIEGIMKNLTDCSLISKRAGGIGVHMSNVRSAGSYIKGTNGKSKGIIKQLKLYNAAADCWDQGGDKRKGAFSIYLEPWHGDIEAFLDLKLNNGAETERARDLFYALWCPDLFFKRAASNSDWSLFSEDTAPGLSGVFDGMEVCRECGGFNQEHPPTLMDQHKNLYTPTLDESCKHEFETRDVFTQLYERYERWGLAVGKVKAVALINKICNAQRESGTPYVCLKDAVNQKTPQKSIGTIKSSNLCAEIMEWSSDKSYATCTLGSVNFKKFVTTVGGKKVFDFSKFIECVRLLTRNLDIIIDINEYPVPECAENSKDYRPIAIGEQGLHDLFLTLGLPFLSADAEELDLAIHEAMYYAALKESCERAKVYGAYKGFWKSPTARGILQFDLWGVKPSERFDWDALRADIMKYGLRNSLLVALMPTVSTAQIMGNNESFEPFTSNIYSKTTLAGKFTICNNYMIRHFIELGLWNEEVRNHIITNGGSVQGLNIPKELKELYLTVWEMPQMELMRRAAARGAYVDQSMSLNIYLSTPSNANLRGIMMYGYKLRLKTVSYYVRSKPAVDPLKNITVDAPVVVATSASIDTTTESDTQKDTGDDYTPEGIPLPSACKWTPGCTTCAN
jgi:ribonucleoside-diphosphate reductase alpha subunit